MSSWRLFSSLSLTAAQDNVNPLDNSITRMMIDPGPVEGLIGTVLRKTMRSGSHGPGVVIHRIQKE